MLPPLLAAAAVPANDVDAHAASPQTASMMQTDVGVRVGGLEQRGARTRLRARVDGERLTLATFEGREPAEGVRRGLGERARAQDLRSTGPTLAEWGEEWLERRERKGVRSITSDRSRWARHIAAAPFFCAPLADIRHRHVQAWADALSTTRAADRRGARGLSPQTVRHVVNLLRASLTAAIRAEHITRNVCFGVELPPVSREAWTYLLPDEQRRLVTCDGIPEPDRLAMMFALGTGLRQGEQWCLELRDLDVRGPSPRVVVRWGSPGKPPKNGKVRTVPLFGLGLEAARRWLEIMPAHVKANPLGLVWPTARGHRRRMTKPPRGWRDYLRSAGLSDAAARHDGRAVIWHALRHTCAASLVSGWHGRVWTLLEVRDVLGHTSQTVTERYAHLAPSALAAAAAATPGAAWASHPVVDVGKTLAPSPKASPELKGLVNERATEDSNLWPSAPEAIAVSSNSDDLRVAQRPAAA
jgi:integrase